MRCEAQKCISKWSQKKEEKVQLENERTWENHPLQRMQQQLLLDFANRNININTKFTKIDSKKM